MGIIGQALWMIQLDRWVRSQASVAAIAIICGATGASQRPDIACAGVDQPYTVHTAVCQSDVSPAVDRQAYRSSLTAAWQAVRAACPTGAQLICKQTLSWSGVACHDKIKTAVTTLYLAWR